jgi:branched-chain amino acid transport system permease protein
MQWATALFPWISNGPLILVQVLSGLGVGMFLFLVSSGMSLIFGVTRIVNLAHGSFYMLAAYLMYTFMAVLPESAAQFWIALALAPLGVAALGGLIEVSLLRPLYKSEHLFQLLLTFGLILIFQTLVLIIWGPENKAIARPELLAGSVSILGQPFPSYYLMVLGLGPVLMAGLWYLFYRTRWGRLIRAATVDREMLAALGVDVAKLFTSVFIFGSWLAGLGGALAAPVVAVALGMDGEILISAFVVVVIGGMGSFAGSLISSLLVGELQSFGILIFPAISLVLMFALMAVVLIVRPWGLMGRPEE